MMKIIVFSNYIYIYISQNKNEKYIISSNKIQIQFKYKHLLIYAHAHIIFSPLYAYSKNSSFYQPIQKHNHYSSNLRL